MNGTGLALFDMNNRIVCPISFFPHLAAIPRILISVMQFARVEGSPEETRHVPLSLEGCFVVLRPRVLNHKRRAAESPVRLRAGGKWTWARAPGGGGGSQSTPPLCTGDSRP
jgi:hypothetical protein